MIASFGFVRTLRRSPVLGMPAILCLLAAAYVLAYALHPARPGNADVQGWWGWHDQGLYLNSAKAFALADFSPEQHFYPPLYPALGVLFLGWSGEHPFFAPNLVAFLWVCFVFIRFSDQYLPRTGSVSVLLLALLLNWRVSENYIIPWNSILSDALLATGFLALVWLAEAEKGVRGRVNGWQIAVAALCLGMIVPTRPPDAVAGLIAGMGIIAGCLKVWKIAPERLPRVHVLAAALSAAACGPLVQLIFNRLVHFDPERNYILRHASGYHLAELPVKFVSFWLDASALYGKSGIALTEHYPWLLASLAGCLWALVCGDRGLRIVSLAVAALFITYLPFAYIIPNVMWRFMSIHYFKWTFPYLGLFAVLLVKNAVSAWRGSSGRLLPTSLLLFVPLILLSLHLVSEVRELRVRDQGESGGIAFEFPAGMGMTDFVDVSGLSRNASATNGSDPRVIADGRELEWLMDFNILRVDTGVRLFFSRPIKVRCLEFYPDKRDFSAFGVPSAHAGRCRFALGALRPFRTIAPTRIATAYRLGDTVDFSTDGNSRWFAVEGWSEPEQWGSWSLNERAQIKLRLPEKGRRPLRVQMEVRAYVPGSRVSQRVAVLIDGKEAARREFRADEGGGGSVPWEFDVPEGLPAEDGMMVIEVLTPDSVSPSAAGEGGDRRKLGVGMTRLRIVPPGR